MIILIRCDGCGDRFGSMKAYEAHRPGGACLPPEGRAAAGLAERVHRDQSCHRLGRIRYWGTAAGATP